MESTHSSLDHHGYHQISFLHQCRLQDSSKELHSIFIKSSRSKPPWLLMSTVLFIITTFNLQIFNQKTKISQKQKPNAIQIENVAKYLNTIHINVGHKSHMLP